MLNAPTLRTTVDRGPAVVRGLAIAMVAMLFSSPSSVQAEVSSLRETPIVRAVRNARPSVVNIQGQKTVPDEANAGSTRQVNGMGTGVVIDPRGYILTNHHVVDGVRQIRVTLDDGKVSIAQIIARDRQTDLAVIKINVGRSLPIITIGTSADLMPGEPVIAVGNAYGYEHTVTRGIISALNRDVQVSDTQAYDDLIQTDASINPGNSGGPLLSIEGKMIGVNVAVRAGAQGIGFAIPVDNALRIATKLMSAERLENKWHGIQTTRLGSQAGNTVRRVASGSPAAACGLRPGDVLHRLGDVDIERPLDIERALLGRRTGDRLDLSVERNGESMDLRMVVARRGTSPRSSVARKTTASSSSSRTASRSSDDRAWKVLGLTLDTEPSQTFQRRETRYRGGMRVVDVRSGGPAAEKGIQAGDILVGMHRWETASEEDIDYIVNNRALATMNTVKFYILRGDETLYGEMRVAHAAAQRTRR